MNKLYDRIDFVNNTTPALNETNLNAMSKALDDIDDRVIDIAGDVLVVVPEILDKYADIEALATNPPYIGNNGHWWTWDTDTNQYVDSGVDAGVSVNVGTTTTLPAGSDATVTNSGTDTDPILNFGIPQGVAGQNGQNGADGQDGVSPEVTITPITDGHTVTITDADHPIGQSFNVMNGTNGQGVPASGTTGQVLTKASNADYDTTWTTPSGGSGGHTILNGSGSAMTQRTNLQFVGADVTDDSANDKTIVTTTPQSMIGDAWASGQAYAVGDYRIDGNVLYKCKTAHTSSSSNRPPYASYWDAVTVASQLGGGKSVSINLTLGDTRKQIAKTIAQNIDFSKVTANTVFHFEAYYNNAKYSIAYQVIRFSDSNITISTNIDINNDTSSEVFIGTIENSNNTRWQRIIFNSNGSISWSNEASSVMYASGTYTSPKCTVIY